MSFSNFIPIQPKKCQCISFNKKGFIVESDNALFNTGEIMGMPLTAGIPFLKKIFKQLLSLKPSDEPLFFPNINLNLGSYSSICDFIFTKVEHADGESIVWFIYDNSTHYRDLIHSPNRSRTAGAGKPNKKQNYFD